MINKNKPQDNKPHYLGHRSRLKGKFLQSSDNFPEYELLEILLFSANPRGDTKPLAKELLKKFGNLNKVINADEDLLRSIKGVGDNVIVSLKIVKEVTLRSLKSKIVKTDVTTLRNWQFLLDYCRTLFSNSAEESFYVLFLDKKYQLISNELVMKGGVEKVDIDGIKIVKKALLLSSSFAVLTHNHPTSDVNPSKADLLNTKKITELLNNVEVKVLDHLIVGSDGSSHFSFYENNLL